MRIERKPPHTVSNRALSSVVGTLNKPGEGTDTQEDTEEQTDDSERLVAHLLFFKGEGRSRSFISGPSNNLSNVMHYIARRLPIVYCLFMLSYLIL